MTPEQWQTLQGLFEEVIQQPFDKRPDVLSRLESEIQDPAVRLELRRLVEHAEVGSEFLRPVAAIGRSLCRSARAPAGGCDRGSIRNLSASWQGRHG